MVTSLKKIAKYWEDPNTRSLIDTNLKQFEMNTIIQSLKHSDYAIDIGCGDGIGTCEFSKHVKKIIGIDNSQTMLNKARKLKRKGNYHNLEFFKQNILDLKTLDFKFDVTITDRVLVNLPRWRLQRQAILDIKSILKQHGRYIMIEAFDEGNKKMNYYRKLLGLKEISQHWHNTYLNRNKTISFLKQHFKIVKEYNFNLYYLLTRLYTPMFASFVGFGKNAKADPIFKKTDPAAAKLSQILSSKLKLLEGESLGPICGFLLIKK